MLTGWVCALELAARGAGEVAPNPMVGCVIVNKQQIIGAGWHMRFATAHAELNALSSIRDPQQACGATCLCKPWSRVFILEKLLHVCRD